MQRDIAIAFWHLVAVCTTLALLMTLGPPTARAEVCPGTHRYLAEVTADDTPECLSVAADTTYDYAYFDVENNCDQRVDFQLRQCATSCDDSFDVASDYTDSITLADPDSSIMETMTVVYDWSLGDMREGTVEIEVSNNSDHVDCSEWGSRDTGSGTSGDDADAAAYSDAGSGSGSADGGGCRTAGPSIPSPLWYVVFGCIAVPAWRRHRDSS